MNRKRLAKVGAVLAFFVAPTGFERPAQAAEPAAAAVGPEFRVITTEDVWRAIEVALWRQGSPLGREIRPQDLRLGAAIRVPVENPELVVRELAADPLLHRIRFRLSVEARPKQPPFYVWYAVPEPRVTGEPGRVKRASFSVAAPARGETLVAARRPARLHLHSRDYSAMLDVRPLENGNSGETVRVRLPSNGKTLEATVVGKDLVDATF